MIVPPTRYPIFHTISMFLFYSFYGWCCFLLLQVITAPFSHCPFQIQGFFCFNFVFSILLVIRMCDFDSSLFGILELLSIEERKYCWGISSIFAFFCLDTELLHVRAVVSGKSLFVLLQSDAGISLKFSGKPGFEFGIYLRKCNYFGGIGYVCAHSYLPSVWLPRKLG